MFNKPIHLGVRYGSLVDVDVRFIAELEELLSSELHAIIRDDRVWDFEAMEDVEEEQHVLLRLDRGDQPSFYPFCKLVYGDKQVGVASGTLLRGLTKSSL